MRGPPDFAGGQPPTKPAPPRPAHAASTGVWQRFVVASLMPKTGSRFLARCSGAASFPVNVPDKLRTARPPASRHHEDDEPKALGGHNDASIRQL
jgi:hypothetical protein